MMDLQETNITLPATVILLNEKGNGCRIFVFTKIFKIAALLYGMLMPIVVTDVLLSSCILQMNSSNNKDYNQYEDPICRNQNVNFNLTDPAMISPSITPFKYTKQEQPSRVLLDGDSDAMKVENMLSRHRWRRRRAP